MIKDYQEFCKSTWNDEPDFKLQVSNVCMGLCGEAGEVTDILKKSVHHGHATDLNKLVKEIGDVGYYLAQLCNLYGIDLEAALKLNEEKLRKRYPNGFSTEDSIARKDVK
jgi:NTP pyrophosphatase (non-canonical NTP hydrolase)